MKESTFARYKAFSICHILLVIISVTAAAQIPPALKDAFPQGTTFHQDIRYARDTLKKHLLDIYLPPEAKGTLPLLVWIHGGAWNHNDKYADMGYMKQTIKSFLDHGFVLASIDYRFSTTSPFPAQIQDCYQALEFLTTNAAHYHIDKNRIALVGFSAGGHLASLLGLSLNNSVAAFFPNKMSPTFKIMAVVDFYGPADLLMMSAKYQPDDHTNSIAQLLGAPPLQRPDLARAASPVTYVDQNDPPFFIVNGERDESVPYQQSVLLKSYLDLVGVSNEITIVKDAPHYGVMFDSEDIRSRLFNFLHDKLK